MEVWKISKDKSGLRETYKVSMPTCVEPSFRLFSELHEVLMAAIGCDILVPDIAIPRGGSLLEGRLVPQHMHHGRFHTLLRELLLEQPLNMQLEQAVTMTSYSLRRLNPSMADALQMSDTERNQLGNWRDGTGGSASKPEPMRVRYSASRLQATAEARRVILQAFYHVCRHIDKPTFEHVATVARYMQSFRKSVMTSEWGSKAYQTKEATVPSPEEEQAMPDPSNERSDSSDQDSASNSDSESTSAPSVAALSDEEPLTAAWAAPRRGLIHLLTDETSRATVCGRTSLAWVGCELGHGAFLAKQTNRQLCSTCAARRPGFFTIWTAELQ